MKKSEEQLPHNYHTTTTGYYHAFLSYITDSIYHVVVVVVKYPHVTEMIPHDHMTHHDPLYPLMIIDYYHKNAFHLREHREKSRGSYVVVIFQDFYFAYGIGQKNGVVKCGNFFAECGSYSKPGGVFN